MYEERKKLTLKDILVQLLIIVLFVFILIWLFPTKGYINNNYASTDDVKHIQAELEALYGRVFADNIESMKSAAQGYFTTPRLPKNVGDSVTLTLGDMLDKKLVLPFKDSKGESCDTTKSYVQLTKMDDEYQMKVQLSCSDYEDYIIAYMGCYSYCDGLCEVEKPTVKPDDKPNVKPTVKEYRYKYSKQTQDEYSAWSNWSNWSTTAVTSNDLRQVEKDTFSEFAGYVTRYRISYETVPVYSTRVVQKQIGTQQVPVKSTQAVDTKTLVDSKNPTTTTTQGTYGNWYSAGTVKTTNQILISSNTVEYKLESTDKTINCNNGCTYDITRTYSVKKRTYTPGKTNTTCPTGYVLESGKCNKYEIKTTNQTVTKYIEQPIYQNVTETYQSGTERRQISVPYEEATYRTVTKYRYRTRTLVSKAGVSIKYSKSANDADLIKNGYKLIAKEEV